MATKERYHHGDLPNALLDAVEQIIVEDGVQGVSLRRAARAVGVSHAAPAHHFGDLAGLVRAVAVRGHERFAAALRAGRDGAVDRSVEGRLQATGSAYMHFAIANPGVFSIMFRGDLDGIRDDPATDAFGVLTGLITEGLDVADAGHPAVWRLSMLVWSAVHGATTLWLQGTPRRFKPDVEADVLLDVVAGGVLAALHADPAWAP